MREVPKLAQVKLETITPLHIGAGQGGGKPFDDECLDGRSIPREYRPPPRRHGMPEVVKLRRSWSDRKGTPYIPASTLRGFLRGLYTGALEADGATDPVDEADKIFGSTDQAGAIALNDLLPDTPPETFTAHLKRYLPATTAAGRSRGRSKQSFDVEMVEAGAAFTGQALYVDDTLREVLEKIYAQRETLTEWLYTGSGNRKRPNPERTISGSPIHKVPIEEIKDRLFEQDGDRWTITWKLGRYAKSYAKALARRRSIGLPHAYYLVDGQVPGWVRVTFDLAPPGAEFRLNEWLEEA